MYSLFTGTLFYTLIRDELLVAFKRPTLPAASIREIFSKGGLKTLGAGLKSSEVWKELGKEGALHGAAFIPGAALGYLALDPVVTKVGELIVRPADTQVSNVQPEGKLVATEQQQQK